MKTSEKIRAINLRKQGKSYNEILNEIAVSKSTLSIWLRNIPLRKEQQERLTVHLRQENIKRLATKRKKYNQRKRRENIKQATFEFKNLFKNQLFLIGLMLYWAEGDKSEKSKMVKFSNSDPQMIELMMCWFKTICCVPDNKFKAQIHIHSLHSSKKCIEYWSKITKISKDHFHKTQIKKTSLGHRKNILYNGTCSIRIYDVNLFRKIIHWTKLFKKSPCSSMDRTRPF